MLRADDLAKAVDTGLISAAQARGLDDLARNRRAARAFAAGRDERFRLLGGFNDLFIAIGVLLLGLGVLFSFGIVLPTTTLPIYSGQALPYTFVLIVLVGLSMFWGLAELLTGRMRLVAPSIIIVVFLAIFASIAGWAFEVTSTLNASGPAALRLALGIPGPVSALAVVGLHYARFRLPFSLFVLAFVGVVLGAACVTWLIGKLGFSEADVGRSVKWVVFGLGLCVFAWAMWFDVSDPERLSRRADCGFWLHLLAAPLIVHPLAGPLINHPFFNKSAGQVPVVTSTTIALVFALILALSLVAIVIDRRALLVAGLGYLGSALASAISQIAAAGTDSGLPAIATLAVLGSLIIILGVAWRTIRHHLLVALPGHDWKAKLPPAVARGTTRP